MPLFSGSFAAAEPPDGRGRRRLVVSKYSHGGFAGGGRGRHYARGGYWEKKADGTYKWRTVSLQGSYMGHMQNRYDDLTGGVRRGPGAMGISQDLLCHAQGSSLVCK